MCIRDRIKSGGYYISLSGDGLAKKPGSVHQKKPLCIMGCVQHQNLEALSGFVQAGKLRPYIEQVFDWSMAQAAFNHSLAGHTTGKVAVVPPQVPPSPEVSAFTD
eukprot:TRINITY_DN38535_c0_g1_i2.p2 TRINITY_DN38535_c0_g1~~TRINITY_DN38535_c0_g1_i2.p2  ORF type:complete len:105 (-),score=33.21 TRINITY_DN38535_c0_g1_i2:77-391(-)